MRDDYTNKEYTSKSQGNLNTTLATIGTAGAIPTILSWLNGSGVIGGGNRQSQLEAELVYEKGKNYTDQAVIAGMRQDEQNRKEVIQQVVANKEEVASLKTELACREKYQKELDELRAVNTDLKIKDAITSAVEPLKGDIIRLRDGTMALRQELVSAINLEAERRNCADQKIICYANATFAPKLISGYTADATSATLAEVGNPLCGCCCNQAA